MMIEGEDANIVFHILETMEDYVGWWQSQRMDVPVPYTEVNEFEYISFFAGAKAWQAAKNLYGKV